MRLLWDELFSGTSWLERDESKLVQSPDTDFMYMSKFGQNERMAATNSGPCSMLEGMPPTARTIAALVETVDAGLPTK